MQLVILAAGHGRRFGGGLKQLAPVGPEGQAIMDYTAMAAHNCGFDGVVVIIREEIREEVANHIRRYWPSEIEVDLLCQGPIAGTAQAVLSARPALRGPFGVANADDLYGEPALRDMFLHFHPVAGSTAASNEKHKQHLLVAYHLVKTVLTSAPLIRGLCDVESDGNLQAIVETRVCLRADGRFDAEPLVPTRRSSHNGQFVLNGDEWVSMNLWGFHLGMLERLENALEFFDPAHAARPELLLPEVVGELVTSGRESVHVTATNQRCIGITHSEDTSIVSEELGFSNAQSPALRGETLH